MFASVSRGANLPGLEDVAAFGDARPRSFDEHRSVAGSATVWHTSRRPPLLAMLGLGAFHMQHEVSALLSRASLAFALCTWLCAACSASDEGGVVTVPPAADGGEPDATTDDPTLPRGCVEVEVDGEQVVEYLEDFTARFELGDPYNRTLMMFGGMAVQKANTPTRAYIFGLDKVDAQRMAKLYPDFYLCSSVGGQEAATYIEVYDIVPATCKVHQQLVAAFRVYAKNAAEGGDRTSLRLEGSPLTIKSITQNTTGQDVSDQVSDQKFHLITGVQQLTGQSLLGFGTTE